jgi:hypothetical protein
MVHFILLEQIIKNIVRQNKNFGRLLMSQDVCPTWIALLEPIYRIIFLIFSHSSHILR